MISHDFLHMFKWGIVVLSCWPVAGRWPVAGGRWSVVGAVAGGWPAAGEPVSRWPVAGGG